MSQKTLNDREKQADLQDLIFVKVSSESHLSPSEKVFLQRNLPPDLRNSQLSQSVTELLSLAGSDAYAYALTCSSAALLCSED